MDAVHGVHVHDQVETASEARIAILACTFSGAIAAALAFGALPAVALTPFETNANPETGAEGFVLPLKAKNYRMSSPMGGRCIPVVGGSTFHLGQDMGPATTNRSTPSPPARYAPSSRAPAANRESQSSPTISTVPSTNSPTCTCGQTMSWSRSGTLPGPDSRSPGWVPADRRRARTCTWKSGKNASTPPTTMLLTRFRSSRPAELT